VCENKHLLTTPPFRHIDDPEKYNENSAYDFRQHPAISIHVALYNLAIQLDDTDLKQSAYSHMEREMLHDIASSQILILRIARCTRMQQ
jgi:hypothetical protein